MQVTDELLGSSILAVDIFIRSRHPLPSLRERWIVALVTLTRRNKRKTFS